MGIISWIILGIAAGVAVSYFTRRTEQLAYLVNSVIGIIGAAAGGFTANLVMRLPPLGYDTASFFVAILGTLVFLTVANALKRS